MSNARPLVYARVAFWEYGCCGDLPLPGARVSATLTAAPAGPTDRFVVDRPITWITGLDLVRSDAWSAHWEHADGDPTTQPIILRLSWHDDSGARPSVTGTVRETFEERLGPATDPPGLDAPPQQYRRVGDVERRPVDFDSSLTGLMVGFVPDSSTEPTTAAIAEQAARRERAAREIHVFGPALAFGDTAPARDDSVRIDLDDPRLRITANRSGLSGVVVGTANQVGRAIPAPSGMFAMITTVTAGTSASSIDGELFLVVVVDRQHFD